MFESNTSYTNRYRDQYTFNEVKPNVYQFKMSGTSMDYCRSGLKEGQTDYDPTDIGFIDPSGGPFLEPGIEIDGRKVVRIFQEKFNIYLEVK